MITERIDTYQKLVTWIADNTSAPINSEAALWFVSYQVALEFSEYTVKELARAIEAGIGPVDAEYVTAWLTDFYEEYLDVLPDLTIGNGDGTRDLIDMLNYHFNS